jgi:hypothetical protein
VQTTKKHKRAATRANICFETINKEDKGDGKEKKKRMEAESESERAVRASN